MKIQYGAAYFVGDPIHVLGEENMLDVHTALQNSNEAIVYLDGHQCWVCKVDPTAVYSDQNMNEFSLPSGIIGLIHSDAISDPEGEEMGAMVTPENTDFTCERELAGEAITIGDLIISRA